MKVKAFQHFTVDADGRLSLWDSQEAAERGMQDGEVYVCLVLGGMQLAALDRACQQAEMKRKH